MDGGLCEEVVVHERELLPCSLPPEKAAALPLSLLTAWHMLVGRAQIKAGDRVLVQAGASGVGSLAIQIAKLCGAQVAATASTPEKRARCLEIGADACWTYDEAVSHAKTWTQKSGVDVVLDHVGTATWESSLRMLRRGGTYVTCGATTGHLATLNLRLLFFKQLNIMGSTMGSMAEMHQAWDLASMGAIEPVVDRVLPVRELGLAHQLLEDRNVTGKIVIALGDPTDW